MSWLNYKMLLGMVVLFSIFLFGGANQAQARDNNGNRVGYRHNSYHHYGYYHHHRGYWNDNNGVRLWINL